MYSPRRVKPKAYLLILGQLWDRETKFGLNTNIYKYLIFREIGLSPYLCADRRLRACLLSA